MCSGSLNRATFHDWVSDRHLMTLGTNAGARALPFQGWRNIKEAFAPELVARALGESPIRVRRCLDPFGGSGTTGLACQFLGVYPVISEVNPYLADLIEAKLTPYRSVDNLHRDIAVILDTVDGTSLGVNGVGELFSGAPKTFVEPGDKGRWIFNRDVAERIVAIRMAIDNLDDPTHRRLLRVLLGGVLIEVSNVVVSGKGRRYRRQWLERSIPPEHVSELLIAAADRALDDIERFGRRAVTAHEVIRGDGRIELRNIQPCEIAVFSPPYPNSSDYTDVYNVELWALGYLDSSDANATLRTKTLSSHVQIARMFAHAPSGSPTLGKTIGELNSKKDELWDQKIPAMIGAYFAELCEILDRLGEIVTAGGTVWIVVGDSRYGGIQIVVADVLHELAEARGWRVLAQEQLRAMRTSAQQGGQKDLAEHLLVLQNLTANT